MKATSHATLLVTYG